MKKLVCFTLIFCLILTACTTSYAEMIPCDLKFIPDEGGKYIYCNNPESIRRKNLSDSSNENPSYMMNNENLEKGKYTYFVSQFNRTELKNTEGIITEQGFDIELDIEFRAKTDTEILLAPIGFETSKPKIKYSNGNEVSYQDTWSFLNALATYKQLPIYTANRDLRYLPTSNKEQTISLKAGETLWLSPYIENYSETSCGSAVFLMGEFEIKQGSCDVNVAALKSSGKLRDRSHHNSNAAHGNYVNDKQYKGIADSHPSVTAKLQYTIDDSTLEGTKLPVRISNQYAKETLSDYWVSNINPQADQWTKKLAAESDMLAFTYDDESKTGFYGKDIPENQRNTIWEFDTFHSDTKEYQGEGFMTPEKFIPNYKLTTETDNINTSCNLGNYGVAVNYQLTINNRGTKDRFLNYKLSTVSPNVVLVKDEQGNPISEFAVCKGEITEKKEDVLASVLLPKGEEKTFTIEVTLPTNVYGGMQNAFEIADKLYENNFIAPTSTEILQNYKYTGREYYRWDGGELFVSKDLKDWQAKALDEKTKAIFKDNWNNFEIFYTNQGYMLRWDAYDGALGWYISTQPSHNQVYFLNNEWQLTGAHDFDSYILKLAYANGQYFVKTTAKTYLSADLSTWTEINRPMPVANGSPFCFDMKNAEVYASTDTVNYQKVSYMENTPIFMRKMGNYFYYIKDNRVFVSINGIYWRYLQIDEKVKTAVLIGNTMLINDTYTKPIPEMKQEVVVSLNNEILGFDKIPIVRNDRILVPMRYIFEKLGAQVTWDESSRTATMNKNEKEVSFQIGSNFALVNGVKKTLETPAIEENERTLVPIRFFTEELGMQVDWDAQRKLVTIY